MFPRSLLASRDGHPAHHLSLLQRWLLGPVASQREPAVPDHTARGRRAGGPGALALQPGL